MNLLKQLLSALKPALVQPDPTPAFIRHTIPLGHGWRLELNDVFYGTYRVRVLVGPKTAYALTMRHPFVVPPSRN